MSDSLSQKSDETTIVHGIKTSYINSMDLVPPIHMTSTFRFKNQEHGAGIFAGTEDGFVYSRISNPTIALLQEKIAAIEGTQDAIATASGLAAVAATVLSLAAPGNNIIVCNAVYGGTFALFNTHFKTLGIEPRFISPAKSNVRKTVETALDNKTALMFVETPANPTLDVIDIELWAAIAKKKGIPLVVDNTFASPYLQKPVRFGADIVIHSATKYLGGHGDIIGGIIAGQKNRMDQIRESYMHHFGPAMSPFNAWLILRGIKTLAVRMDRHSSNAMKIATWLETHPKIARVHYPGLASHPFHDIAKKQMKQFSGVLGFVLKGGMEAGKILLNAVNLCILAVSLGDCETLIQHPASMTHATYTPEERKKAGIDEGLIRLSLGLENDNDIIADLESALSKVN